MKATIELFLPIVRFAGHSLATAIGFVVLVVITLIPIYALKIVASANLDELDRIINWHAIEMSILYLDIGLYAITVALWAVVFVVEEFRAVRTHIWWQRET